jgi:hypothetical protein
VPGDTELLGAIASACTEVDALHAPRHVAATGDTVAQARAVRVIDRTPWSRRCAPRSP